MNVNPLFAVSNPFVDAYLHSDIVGKAIFVGLIFLSMLSWILIIYKAKTTLQAQRQSWLFEKAFSQQSTTPLQVEFHNTAEGRFVSPFWELYLVLKKQAVDLLNKNRHFTASLDSTIARDASTSLSSTDIASIEAHLASTIAAQKKKLEDHLYLLSTIVSLAPFLGLLGTVWGILMTFSELQGHAGAASHTMALNGLSLALATTVIGLIDAIPALVGYNYLKNSIRSFEVDMGNFAMTILTAVELQYRKVEV